ncbi:MAG: hypothetical protein ACRD12_19335 [Acidimicrobiales bacterium]
MPKSLLAVFAALVLLSACSNGSGTSGAPITSATTSATTSADPTLATTTTEPTFTGAGSQPFCDDDRAARARLDELNKAAPSTDALKIQYTATAEALRSLSGVAPAEIAGDIRTLSQAYDGVIEGMTRVNWDASQVLNVVSERMGGPQIKASSDRLQAYERKVCGIT